MLYFRDRNSLKKFLAAHPNALAGAVRGQDFNVVNEMDLRFSQCQDLNNMASLDGVFVEKGMKGMEAHAELLDRLNNGGNICVHNFEECENLFKESENSENSENNAA